MENVIEIGSRIQKDKTENCNLKFLSDFWNFFLYYHKTQQRETKRNKERSNDNLNQTEAPNCDNVKRIHEISSQNYLCINCYL